MSTPQMSGRSVPDRSSLLLVIAVAIFCIISGDLPFASIIFGPVHYFTTALHEIGHALACNATGGSVNSLTIVSDGGGNAGVTYCTGGVTWIYGQAGYLGTTISGCLMLWVSSYQRATRPLLVALSALIGFAIVWYMVPGLTMTGMHQQAFYSILVGVAICCTLLAMARWLPWSMLTVVVLFLSVQTALNALYDINVLLKLTLGFGNSVFSDAVLMSKATWVPAILWSIGWGVTSIVLLFLTMRLVYGGRSQADQTGN